MAINFPDSPSNGDTYTAGGKTFTYDSTVGAWSPAGAGATTFIGLTDTPNSFGTASQIPAINSGANALEFIALPSSVTVYATIDLLPLSGNNAGDQALVTATNRLYIWNGSGWYNIALINTSPTISGVNSSYDLAIDGTATVITITATDPEGIPITYSIASDTSGSIATVTQGTGSNTNVFTITPSTNDANAGTFSLTFRASDGVNIGSSIASFTLEFKVVNSNYTTALITSVGANNAVNNSFVDSSTNSHTITAAGNVTQNTFSPYRHGGYSYHWDGSGTDYFQILSPTAALDFGTGDFTIEMQIWLNDLSSPVMLVDTRPSETNGNQYFYFPILTDGNIKLGSNNVDRIITTGGPITAGTWHHFALQRDNGTLQIYVDGTLSATATWTQSLDASRWSLFKNSFASGGVVDAGGGYIKDYRVVKGTAVYSGATYDVPTEPLTAISGTSFLLFSDNIYIRDESVGTETITWTNGMYEPFSPYDYIKYNSSENGGSMYFDGNGDRLDFATSTDFTMGTGDFTIELWYLSNTSYAAANGYLFDLGTNGTRVQLYNNQLYFVPSAGSNIVGTAGTGMLVGTWYHVAVVRSGSTITLYLNGVSIGSVSNSSDLTDNDCHIGDYGGGNVNFNGYISDFRIVKGTAVYTSNFTPPTAPLTAITNTSLLINGTNAGIIDKSQSVKTITLNGDVKSSTAQTKYLASSIYFDGTGDYITSPASDLVAFGTGDFTIEFWAYSSDISGSTQRGFFQTSNVAGGLSTSYTSGIIVNQGVANSGALTGGVRAVVLGTAINSVGAVQSINTWHHFALVRSSGTITLYVDGTSVASATQAGSIDGQNLVVGGYYSTSFLYQGYLSDLRITKGLARYTTAFTPPTAELKG